MEPISLIFSAIIDAASSVMRIADPDGAGAGKYNVNLAGAPGVQVGDDNTQTNYFGPGGLALATTVRPREIPQ